MSRIRSVHPGFFRDDRLVPCSAFARLLFIGLGVEADDKGIFEWKPVTLKMSIFPGDNVDMQSLLAELVEADAIKRFEVDGKAFGAIRNFRKYQKPKTPNDIHPMPDDIAEYVAFPRKEETAPDERGSFPQNGEKPALMEDGRGNRRGIGEEREGARARAGDLNLMALPADWSLSDERLAVAMEVGLTRTEAASEGQKFCDRHRSRGTERADWESEWSLWCRRALERAGRPPPARIAAFANRFHVKPETPQWEAWARNRGKPFPVDSNGGWWADSEWPPDADKESAA